MAMTKGVIAMILLEKCRKEKGVSIRKLSLMTGVSRTYLTGLEEGIYENPGVRVICAICKALDITPNDIIEEEYWSN